MISPSQEPSPNSLSGVWGESDVKPKRFRIGYRRSGEFYGTHSLLGRFERTPLTIEAEREAMRNRRLLLTGIILCFLWILFALWP